jgi:hypothetical protein
MDSQHGARNKFHVRNKSKQSGNKISMYSDAHIQIRNMGTQKEASAHNDKTEMDNVRMDPVVDLEHCMDNDIQSLLNTDSIPYLPINNRNLNGMMIQNRVDKELHNRFARLEAECCHWRSLAQKLLLANRTVNNQSENFSGNQEILNENKKKRHRSSSSSSSFQALNSAITGNPEVMFNSNWSDEIGLEITEIGNSRSDYDYSTDTVEHSSYRKGKNRNYYNPYQYQRPCGQPTNKFPYNCYHCKKQGHSFLHCRFASQIDKERITSRLNQNNYTGHQQKVEKPRQP